jgi:putative flippase GtrA
MLNVKKTLSRNKPKMHYFYKQSETIRMLIIAVIGVILGFITYEIVYCLNPFSPKATISWILAFIIGIARQHALHRQFTFSHKTSYFKSLYRAYIVDVGALVFSTGLNWFLSEMLHMNHRLVWACCLVSTALISLVFLKKYIFKTEVNSIA